MASDASHDAVRSLTTRAFIRCLPPFVLRYVTSHYLIYNKEQLPSIVQNHFARIGTYSGNVQLILIVACFLFTSVRRKYANLGMYLWALLCGIAGASTFEGDPAPDSYFWEEFDVKDIPGSFEGHAWDTILQMSIDSKQLLFMAMPVAVVVLLLVPGPKNLKTLMAMSAAAVTPYVMVKSGYMTDSSKAMLPGEIPLGVIVAGVFSAFGAFWISCVAHHMAQGRTMTYQPLKLVDPVTGKNSSDASFIAFSILLHTQLTLYWCAVYIIRSLLWILTCGLLCKSRVGKAKASSSKKKQPATDAVPVADATAAAAAEEQPAETKKDA